MAVPPVSVVVCTHNPRPDYLARTLAGLRSQTLPSDRWELVVVDNASRTPVGPGIDLTWHPRARTVREDALGLMAARARGIAETIAPLICFVDDDNVLATDYLETVLALAASHPALGCLGAAVIEPKFEVPPEERLLPYLGMLALRQEPTRWSNIADDMYYPWGAGMVVRREIAVEVAAEVRAGNPVAALDRRGGDLTSCGDDFFSWLACSRNLGRGIFTDLRLTHLISAHRLTEAYLLQLAEAITFSRTLILHMHGRPYPQARPHLTPARIGGLLRAGRWRRLRRECRAAVRERRRPPTERAFAAAVRRGQLRGQAAVERSAAAPDAAYQRASRPVVAPCRSTDE